MHMKSILKERNDPTLNKLLSSLLAKMHISQPGICQSPFDLRVINHTERLFQHIGFRSQLSLITAVSPEEESFCS